MSTVITTSNNNDHVAQPLAITVPCHAAPLPTAGSYDNEEPAGTPTHRRQSEERLLLGNSGRFGGIGNRRSTINLSAEGLMYDEVMEGLSDDETDCQSPVRFYNPHSYHLGRTASITNVHDTAVPASTTSVTNHKAESFITANDNDFENDAFCDDGSDDGVDSMVDVDDRTYEHLFENLTVMAVDDYNNSYAVASSPINAVLPSGSGNDYPTTFCAREGMCEAELNTAPSGKPDKNCFTAATRAIASNHTHGQSPYIHRSYSDDPMPRYFYSLTHSQPHSSTHTHTERNAALLKSANAKYFDDAGHLGWRWGITIGNSAEEIEEEKVWLNSYVSGGGSRAFVAAASADAVPCRECCCCGCNDLNDHYDDQRYIGTVPYIFATSGTYSSNEYPDFIGEGRTTSHQYPNKIRSFRNNSRYGDRRQQPTDPQLSKTQQVMSLTSLSAEECEAKFPYRCGIKEFPSRPTLPSFPTTELGVSFVKCCYYAQRPHKECSMGSKCYHTHDDEDGDLVPEVFADGNNRSEQRSRPSATTNHKLSYASVAAAAAAHAIHKDDSHNASEISTVPQSVCGHEDDEDDARTTAGRGIDSTNCHYFSNQHEKPIITRAQLATVPCQYGAGCALPRHAANARKCGFDDKKLKLYKVYLAELRHYDVQLGAHRKAKIDVRTEATLLQQLTNNAKAAAEQEMNDHMRRRQSEKKFNAPTIDFKWNVSAQGFIPNATALSQPLGHMVADSNQAFTTEQQQQQQNLFGATDFSTIENTMPCLHCGHTGSVSLRSVPVYRPNIFFDGINDRRREVKKHGVAASCSHCRKTFAFDDERQMRAYLFDCDERTQLTRPNYEFSFENEDHKREETVAFVDTMLVKVEPAIVEPNTATYVEDLPW